MLNIKLDEALRIYNDHMDVFSTLNGQDFVWNSVKELRNIARHGVGFEQAREDFLDQLARYGDAVRRTKRGWRVSG